MTQLDALNAMTPAAFAAALEGVFERAPWVAPAAAARRPFATVTALHDALMDAVRQADAPTRTRFLRGHPPLSAAALAGNLTAESAAEQAALGLAGLGAESARFTALSDAYAARHGIPFIICARRHAPGSVLRQLERRLDQATAAEHAAALDEVFLISRLRLVARVAGPGVPVTTGVLSAAVTRLGAPGAGLRVEVVRDGVCIAEATTDAQGQAELLAGTPLRIGGLELRFHLGEVAGAAAALDLVPVRLAVTAPEATIRVALAVDHGSYSVSF
jgi:2-oxo-4-hydroxy-4-carboxy-5-ureidoimidazoline decarboxylase